MNELTNLEHDTLKEIVSIGAGSASGALAKMTKQKVELLVPNLWFVPIEEVASLMGGVEQVATVLMVKITGDATGVVVFFLSEINATKLAESVSQEDKTGVLEETFNIIVGSALTSLSQFLKMHFTQSPPASATDMVGAIINEIVSPMGEQTDHSLLLQVSFSMIDSDFKGELYFMFDPGSSEKLLQACDRNINNNG